MADSMVFYKSFYESLNGLPDDVRLKMLDAIIGYALNGTEPHLEGFAENLFALIRPQLDANAKRRENGKKGAEYGKLGGRPKKTPKGLSKETPMRLSVKTPNVNVNENVNNTSSSCACARESEEEFDPLIESYAEFMKRKRG